MRTGIIPTPSRHGFQPAFTDKHDNFYLYDGLYQVIERQQGNLTGTTGNPYTGIDNKQRDEDWCYDETGNWQNYDYDGPETPSEDVNQIRTHNRANEICSVSGPSGVVQPAYDEVGNQTADIAPGEWDNQYDLKWDAWNRLVEVKDDNTVLQTNAYDGLTRRTTSKKDSNTIHYYYNNQWRTVEEYLDLNATSSPDRRYLWGLGDRWDLVKRLRDDTGNLDEERYVLYDAMDPVAICDENGDVKQRFEYSPFGETTFLNEDYTTDSTPEDWKWLFHGEFRDAETGYYNYGYRFYNDTTGRWISRDPIGERGGHNLYKFTENNPLGKTDELGLVPTGYTYTDPFAIDPLPVEIKEGVKATWVAWVKPVFFWIECGCHCKNGICRISGCHVTFRMRMWENTIHSDRGPTINHERRHIMSRNFQILEKVVRPLEREPSTEHPTKTKCRKAARELAKKWRDVGVSYLNQENHSNVDDTERQNPYANRYSPPQHGGEEPITEEEKDEWRREMLK